MQPEVLLLSRGLGAVPAFLGPSARTVAFIPTAGDVYESPTFLDDDRRGLRHLGYTIHEADVTGSTPDELRRTLTEADAVFVGGGNTFYLLQELRRTGSARVLVEAVRSGLPYMGTSAGAVAAGPSAEPVQTFDDPLRAPLLESFEGLGLVPVVTLPHYGKEKYAGLHDSVLRQHGDRFPIVPIRDDQAIHSDASGNQTIVPSSPLQP